MTEFANPQLSTWETFYVIVGSSGAVLIGVQFVVITLIATARKRTTAEAISAFATSTVVHLGGALLVAALMSAPWPSLLSPSIALTMCGLGGLGYGVVVIRRALRQTDYKPVWNDWLWYAVLPCGTYAALAMAALFLRTTTQLAVFGIGAAALFLLLIGIHNAWDAVTHIVVTAADDDATTE